MGRRKVILSFLDQGKDSSLQERRRILIFSGMRGKRVYFCGRHSSLTKKGGYNFIFPALAGGRFLLSFVRLRRGF